MLPAVRLSRNLRCFSGCTIIRSETNSTPNALDVLQLLNKETKPQASPVPGPAPSDKSSADKGGAFLTLPPRKVRSDTGNVYFRETDPAKYRSAENKYFLHCLTSHSNTLLTLTNHKHEPVMWTSAGLCGFKKAARGGYEAGFRSTTMMLEKMRQKEQADAALELKSRTDPSRVQKVQVKKQKPPFRPASIDLIVKDFGLGREAVMKAILGVEGDHYRNKITKIIDATPLKFGGVRARAVRRL